MKAAIVSVCCRRGVMSVRAGCRLGYEGKPSPMFLLCRIRSPRRLLRSFLVRPDSERTTMWKLSDRRANHGPNSALLTDAFSSPPARSGAAKRER